MDRKQIIRLFSSSIGKMLENSTLNFEQLYEIRLRVGQPFLVVYQGKEYFMDNLGNLSGREAYRVTYGDIRESLEHIAGYSLYAYEEELRQGFLTVQGGHRVGVAGKTILEEEKIKGIKQIAYMNVRLAHEIKGCADQVIPYLYEGNQICHSLIISPPCCGKTTLLRDLIRQISNGWEKHRGQTVGVVDERSEIAGCYQGVPQNDLGIRTDVLDCCPKAEGMMMLIRSMSPKVVAVDEIGDDKDIRAIESVLRCGCTLVATVHGNSIEEVKKKPLLAQIMNQEIFQRLILLENDGHAGVIRGIFNEKGSCLYEKSQADKRRKKIC
jgi:stage III sporulation protein AA